MILSIAIKPYLYGAAIFAVVGGAGWIVKRERDIGARDARIAQLQVNDKAEKVVIAHDSVTLIKHDTVRVFQAVVHVDTLLQSLIDLRHDTVWVTREVLIEAKATLDSTKKVADACCQLARDYKARAASLDSLNRQLLKAIPSPAKAWIDRLEGVGFCGVAVWGAGKLKP